MIVAGSALGGPLWLTAIAVVFGAVVVHLLFESFFGGSRHLGAAAISNDDPLMIAAFEEAKAS